MIYMDHNATTPVLPEARAAVMAALEEGWGNPSSSHMAGRRAKAIVDEARASVAEAANARPQQVTFTSGATEALNHVVWAAGPGRIIATAIEHPAVLAAVDNQPDRTIELAPVDRNGQVDVATLLDLVTTGERPVLVAVMAANNETGVIQPVGQIGQELAELGVPLLVDAVQYIGKLPIAFACDFLVATAHKLGGPKGVGCIVTDWELPPLIDGGGQERGHRGGTEPVPALAGFGAAMRWVSTHRMAESERLAELRDALIGGLTAGVPGLEVVGADAPRLPNTASLLLPDHAEPADVMAQLDAAGVCVSAGSACHAGSARPSRVLTAMGVPDHRAVRAMRLSLGHGSTAAHVAAVTELLVKACS